MFFILISLGRRVAPFRGGVLLWFLLLVLFSPSSLYVLAEQCVAGGVADSSRCCRQTPAINPQSTPP